MFRYSLLATAAFILTFLASCDSKTEIGGSPSNASKSVAYDRSTPERLYAILQSAIEKADSAAWLACMSKDLLDEMAQQIGRAVARAKENPEQLKIAQQRLGTDKDLTKMSIEELTRFSFEQLLKNEEGKRDFMSQFGTKYIDTVTSAGITFVIAEGPARRDSKGGEPAIARCRVELAVVKEGDEWRFDEKLSNELKRTPDHEIAVAGVSSTVGMGFDVEGKTLAHCDRSGKVRLIDVESGSNIQEIAPNGEGEFRRALFSPDLRMAAGEMDNGAIVLWEMRTAKRTATIAADENGFQLFPLAFSPDGKLLVASSNEGAGMAVIWNTATGEVVRKFTPHAEILIAVAFSPDGARMATAGQDKLIKIWDCAKWERKITLTGHIESVSALAFSQDGRRLVSCDNWGGGEKSVEAIVWNVETGESEHRIKGYGATPFIAILPDSAIVCADCRSIRVFSPSAGVELRHRSPSSSSDVTALSPKSGMTATVNQLEEKATIQLWFAQFPPKGK